MTLPKMGVILPVAGIAALLLLTRHCGPTPDPSGPYRAELARMAHQHSLDSAEAAAAYEREAARADSLGKVAGLSLNNARRYQRVADSLARLPRYQPPAVAVTPCDSALILTIRERDTLRAGLDTLTAAMGTLTLAYRGAVETASTAYTGWMRAEGQLSQERAVWVEEREAWQATVRRLKPCRLLGWVGCPTLSVGYGAQLSQGHLTLGPTLSLAIPLR